MVKEQSLKISDNITHFCIHDDYDYDGNGDDDDDDDDHYTMMVIIIIIIIVRDPLFD